MPDLLEKNDVEKEQQELNDAEDKLESKVQEKLATVFDDVEEPTLEKKPEAKSTESEPEVKLEEDSKAKDEPTPEEKPEEDSKAKDEPNLKTEEVSELSDAYVKAAIHQGWTEEEIKDLYEGKPELAKKTFARVFEVANNQAKEFSAIGRTKRELEAKKVAVPEKPVMSEKPVVPEKPKLKAVKYDSVREEYGDTIADIFEAQQAELDSYKEQREQAPVVTTEEAPSRDSIAEREMIGQQIDQFFSDPDMNGYSEFYGTVEKGVRDWNELTGTQAGHRWAVTEMANDIIIGAETQGKEISNQEALNLAHISISEPVREKVIREKIKSNVTKRSKSLTLRSSSTNVVTNDGPKSDSEFEAVTKQRLSKVFN